MTKEEAKALIIKYNSGQCSDQEKNLVEDWYHQFAIDEESGLSESDFDQIGVEMWTAMPDETKEEGRATRSIRLWPRIAAAAVILLALASGIFFYSHYANTLRHLEGSAATRDLLADIKPGTNKAILTLSNGSTITLTDAANGAIARQSGVQITKTANGQLIYTVLSLAPSGRGGEAGEGLTYSNALNTISTPRGGQYQVRLPDGSKVWLNAASKLTYPVSFNGREDRKVELSGEAYFEVAKDQQHPFKVKSNGQEVTVLGTHFNINSYADEGRTRTTLLEGSVKVSSLQPSLSTPSLPLSSLRGGTTKQPQPPNNNIILKPGQQSVLTDSAITVIAADIQSIIAWQNGDFRFDNESVQEAMRKISRWYNVDIKYEGPISREFFSGAVSKRSSMQEVLDIIQATGLVSFKVEGRTVIVKRSKH